MVSSRYRHPSRQKRGKSFFIFYFVWDVFNSPGILHDYLTNCADDGMFVLNQSLMLFSVLPEKAMTELERAGELSSGFGYQVRAWGGQNGPRLKQVLPAIYLLYFSWTRLDHFIPF